MKRLAIFLITAACALAQPWGTSPAPVIPYAPIIHDITHSTVKMTWKSDIAAVWKIKYGLTNAVTSTARWKSGANVIQSGFVSGLAPNTTYYYQVCSTLQDASGNITSESCSTGDRTFTTAVKPTANAPEPPQLPSEDSTDMPAGSYGTPFVVDGSCSNLDSILTSIAALNDSLNYEIQIPAGTVCRGQWKFPKRPTHTGWIVVKSTSAGVPPEGVRTSDNFAATSAKFVSDVYGYGTSSLHSAAMSSIPTSCQTGQVFYNSFGLSMMFLECQGQPTNVPGVISNITWTPQVYGTYSTTTDVVVTTQDPHGLQSGMVVQVDITGTGLTRLENDYGNTNYTGVSNWVIDVIDDTSFSLRESDGIGTYVSGGTWVRVAGWRESFYDEGSNVRVRSGNSLPGSCTDQQYFDLTDGVRPPSKVQLRTIYWCVNGTYQRFRFNPLNIGGVSVGTQGWGYDYGYSSVIFFADNASKYRFIGLEITAADVPPTAPAYWSASASGDLQAQHMGRQKAILSLSPETFNPSTTDSRSKNPSYLVIDRCWIHPAQYPGRTAFAIEARGDHIMIINSRIDTEWWVPVTSRSISTLALEAYGVMVYPTSTYVKIENNRVQGHGINVFFEQADTGANSPPSTDLVYRRNTSIIPDKYRDGSPENAADGHSKKYWNRHHLEWKDGKRTLIEGNVIDGGYADSNRGAFVMLTPTSRGQDIQSGVVVTAATGVVSSVADTSAFYSGQPVELQNGSSVTQGLYQVTNVTSNTVTIAGYSGSDQTGWKIATLSNNVAVSDVMIRYNTFRHGAGAAFQAIGHHNASSGSTGTFITTRVELSNNVWYDMNSRDRASGGRTSPTNTGVDGGFARTAPVIFTQFGIEDLSIHHNTAYNQMGQCQSFFGEDSSTMVAATDGRFQPSGYGRVDYNVYINPYNTTQNYPVAAMCDGTKQGHTFMAVKFPQGYSMTGNVFCCKAWSGTESGTYYTGGNTLLTNASDAKQWYWNYPAEVDFTATLARPYFARMNPKIRYDAGWADAKPGADFDAMDAAAGRVRNDRVRHLSAGSAVISYYAPDAVACTVEYGTSATWGTGTRVADGGGDRNRNVTLSGLTPGTTYSYRVLCAVDQPSGTFVAR